eukprot:TRINITY_DN1515_c0_g1_i2.p1 TRINITY_DN1515_c0_g1~~TRINITY_DN1515_c0_g1_i2.p1  ORF type:complete len:522 (+),score=152.48 TRINITY_DN1515_c0_g1_i2:509-2074(+)
MEISDLEDEISSLSEYISRLDREREWLEGRASVIMKDKNENTNGGGGGSTMFSKEALESLETFLEYYHKSLARLDKARSKAKKDRKLAENNLQVLRANSMNTMMMMGNIKVVREIIISIHAEQKGEIELDLSYVISQCQWYPSYDVRVDTQKGEASLIYYGLIINNSGEEWTNTSLSLSTASPSLGGSLPTLGTMHVRPVSKYERQQYNQYDHNIRGDGGSARFGRAKASSQQQHQAYSTMYASSSSPAMESMKMSSFDDAAAAAGSPPPPPVSVMTSTLQDSSLGAAVFNIPRLSTIEADGVPHKVTIMMKEFPARFSHPIIPRLSPHAYLKATLNNTTPHPLLAGPMNVFMDNNFIAQSSLANTVGLHEKFAVHLGVDSGVRVEYKPVRKLADSFKDGLFSSTKTARETVKHLTVIKNTKSVPVVIVLSDHLPTSSVADIKVKVVEPDMKHYDSKTGDHISSSSSSSSTSPHTSRFNIKVNSNNNVEWRTKIEPGEKVEIPFEYTVEWPKDQDVEFTTM